MTEALRNPATKNKKLVGPWTINRFPLVLKNRYSAYCRATGTTMRSHIAYLLAKVLREAGVDVPQQEPPQAKKGGGL